MKRNLLLSTLLLASASMAAQGFDGSFDEPWETCYPDGKTAVGTQPKDWMASSVCKNFIITITEELVAPDTDRMEEVNGHSVKMWNICRNVWYWSNGAGIYNIRNILGVW